MKSLSLTFLLATLFAAFPAGAAEPVLFFSEPLEEDPGWTTEGDWAFGQPLGQGGCAPHPTPTSPGDNCPDSWGYPDPDSGYTGDNVYGYNLEGDYPNNMPQTYYLTTSPIDCRGYRSVELRFQRWLNVGRGPGDQANLQVSSDGVNWQLIWENPSGQGAWYFTEHEWTLAEHDISQVADRQETVYLRWGMGPTDEDINASGWNIDDIELWGIPPSPTPPPTATPTPTPFGFKSPSPTITPVPTATPTATPSPSPSPTPSPTSTPTPVPTATPSPSTTPTPSVTRTPVPTATPIPTPSPGEPVPIYRFPLDSDPGWTTESAWAFGEPLGGGEIIGDEGQIVFYPNPTSAFTGNYVYGFNLSGGYGSNMPPYSLTTNPIDCSELDKTRLIFHRWLNIESLTYDRAAVEVSPDGENWHTVWENPVADWVTDSSWIRREYDISSFADRQTAVRIRWVMGPTDEWVNASGWNIDDIEIWAVPSGPTPPPTATPVATSTPITTATPAPTATATPAPTPQLPILDYSGDGTSDIAIFRPVSGLWAVRGLTRVYFGSAEDIPVPGDYRGDGTADLAVFRESTGLWAVKGVTRLYFGTRDDLPRPAQWTQDGKIDIAIYRPTAGLWAVRGFTRFYFGGPGDSPVEGYYDGLPAMAGIFRPVSGLWAIRGLTRVYFGGTEDLPHPGDYDGLGRWRPAIFRPATGLWAVRGLTRLYFGSHTDSPVPAGYDGGGTDLIGIFRPASGLWAVRGITRIYFGTSGDSPETR